MSPLIALLLLAVIQGLTEYLPVSSSGHLALSRLYLSDENALPTGAVIEVWLHLGTLLAVLIFYRKRIVNLAGGVLGKGDEVPEQRRLFSLLILGTIPAGLVGVLFEEQLNVLFESPVPVGIALLLTGIILWASRSIPDRQGDLKRLTITAALIIGCVQALAIAPGISRSGFTIVAGSLLGLSIESAAAFSFLLSIPAILGAAALRIPKIFTEDGESQVPLLHLFLSFLTAFGVGLAALGMLLWLARSQKLSWFAPYCWAAGVLAIALS